MTFEAEVEDNIKGRDKKNSTDKLSRVASFSALFSLAYFLIVGFFPPPSSSGPGTYKDTFQRDILAIVILYIGAIFAFGSLFLYIKLMLQPHKKKLVHFGCLPVAIASIVIFVFVVVFGGK
ncbi:MAG: hypothetical protein ACYS8W_18395 [Planctomycetota bacterium]|jgi:hypothetical protein